MGFGSIINNLLDQMAFFHLEAGNYVMTAVALVSLYPVIKKGFEPLPLIPVAFGTLLINIYPDIMYSPEQTSNGIGGLLWYFLQLDEWNILPPFILLGVGVIADFGPLIANPVSFLMGAATQLGIYSAYFFAILLGFPGKEFVAISIIGGTDGPTSLFLCSKLGQAQIMGLIAVVAYSYVAPVPVIQPSLMKLLTTEKERKTEVEQLRLVSKLEKILFLIIVTIVVYLTLPSTTPLVGMPMLGNLLRESGAVKQLADVANNVLMHIVAVLLGTSIGATASVEVFLNVTTIKIVVLDLTAFIFGTVGGVLLDKPLCKTAGRKINPPIGSASVSAAPMAARISQKVGAEADLTNFLLIHVMEPNVAGVIGTAVAADTFMATFEV